MPATLLDKPPYFLLIAPKTPRFKAIVQDVGGRTLSNGYQFVRSMAVLDKLQARIPGLNTLEFPNDRGFALKDVGQSNHPAWSKLRQYQRDTVDLLVSTPHPGMLVELSPGLGKSPVSVIAADAAGYNDVLFVAVKSLRRNWEREVKHWTGREVTQRFQEGPVAGWNITNYDTLVSFYKRSVAKERKPNPYARRWDLVVLDESVLIKNRKSLRTKAVNALRSKTAHAWCLTGSPTTRYADDLWSQLHFCHPRMFTSYWRFAKEFCLIEETVWGTNVIGTRDDVDFGWALRDCMVSFNQKDVLELPSVLHESIDIELLPEQQQVYDALMADFQAELESGEILSTPNRMARLIRLQQVISSLENVGGGDYSAKADAVEDLIETHAVEYPLLVWINWIPGAWKLYERLKKANVNVVIAVGGMKDIEETVESYKRGDVDVLILSMGVGKYGMNLINTRSVIYVDRTFDGDAYYQSLYRIERFGLSHSPVVYTLRVPGTVEELVEENLSGKLETIANVTSADLLKLLKSIGK